MSNVAGGRVRNRKRSFVVRVLQEVFDVVAIAGSCKMAAGCNVLTILATSAAVS